MLTGIAARWLPCPIVSLIDDLAAQVQRNCRISDARSWGFHSVCGLLLRLRELYKWEMGLQPWSKTETADVMAWIEPKEVEWERFQEGSPEPLRIGSEVIDPFDADAVNRHVEPLGFHYAAGHGMAMKPLFVLGELLERRRVAGKEVLIIGRELVKDLSPAPAMSRGDVITVRREAMKWHLWQRLEEEGTKGDSSLAARALRKEGWDFDALIRDPASHEALIEDLAKRETETAVYHELGEIREEERMDGRWGRAFSLSCGTKAELLARGLKDALADTGEGGRMEHIVRTRDLISLGFFAAFSEGLRKALFPELSAGVAAFLESGNWEAVDDIRQTAHRRMRLFVDPILELFEGGLTEKEISRRADDLEERMMGRS